MNIKTFIDETLKELESQQSPLSLILNRCLRIANYFQDIDEIFWIKFNLEDFNDAKKNDDLKKGLYKELLKKYGEVRSKSIWEKFISDYFNLRTINTIKDNKIKDVICGLSVASIENNIKGFQEQIKSNILPEGLHQIDLYFKLNEKQQVDFILQYQINNFRDILSRLSTRAYQSLVKYESKIEEFDGKQKNNKIENSSNIFIIHGHKEAKWRELANILKDDFNHNPIVLNEMPDKGKTIIEKFEYYALQSCYAFAIFTPDDIVENNGVKYFQARPNVIFELGWFCSYLGRSRVCIIYQEGANMDIFSDFQGVIQKKFFNNIKEVYRDIKLELSDINII